MLVPLLADRAYEFQVAVNLNGANGGYLSVARSVVDFTPLIGLSPVPGRIYLPNVASPNPGSVAYTFDINVEAGQTYNIDPAAAEGFIYKIGDGDPNFASVDLPTSGSLYLWNGSSFIFQANLLTRAAFTISSLAGLASSDLRYP